MPLDAFFWRKKCIFAKYFHWYSFRTAKTNKTLITTHTYILCECSMKSMKFLSQ